MARSGKLEIRLSASVARLAAARPHLGRISALALLKHCNEVRAGASAALQAA